jgi:cold shock CspA family protein
MNTPVTEFRRALNEPAARVDRVVAVYEMKNTARFKETHSDDRWMQELAYFYELVTRSTEESGALVRADLSVDRVVLFYLPDAGRQAAADARVAHQAITTNWEAVPWSLATGLSVGKCIAFPAPTGETEIVGPAIERALALAEKGDGQQILMDLELINRVERDGKAIYDDEWLEFSSTSRSIRRGFNTPLFYREYLWSGATSEEQSHAEHRSRSGILARWDPDNGRGLIITDDDERFYTDRRYLARGSKPYEDARMFFLDEDPVASPRANRLAAAAVVLGDKLRGRVTTLNLDEGFAFVEVEDKAGFHQQLITARDVDLEHLSENATVEFFVEENVRGATASRITVVHEVGSTVKAGRPPVAQRFISALANNLRRRGASGAAAAMLNRVSADWVQGPISPERQTDEVFALTQFALEHWLMRGLRALGEGTLAFQLLAQREEGFDPERALAEVEGIRSIVRNQEYPEPQSVRPDGVVGTLNEIVLALRAANDLTDERLDTRSKDEAAAKATEHLALALANAFRGAVVTSLPPETAEAVAALRNPQHWHR